MRLKIYQLISSLSKASLVLLVLSILALVNFVLSFFPIRADLTSNKAFTLSKVTRERLANLPDIVNIKAFVSAGMPARFVSVRLSLADTLKEYERLSKGKIRVSYIDPKDDLDKKQQALSLGVPELRFSDIEANKLAVSTGYLGLALVYGEKSAALPVIEDVGNLEYELTSRLAKLTRDKAPVIGVLSGYGEKEMVLGRRMLSTEFELREVRGVADIDGVGILLVIGSSQEFKDGEKEDLKAFVDRGGSLLLALDGVGVANNLQAGPVGHNLFDLLEEFGMKLNSDLVLSSSNEIANFSAGATMFFTPYPFWVKIQKQGFNQEIGAVARLETALFPWASSINVKCQKPVPSEVEGSNVKCMSLIKTTPQSWVVKENFQLDPGSIGEPKKEELAEAVVGAISGKVILIGDSDWVEDELLQRFEANAVLLLNLVDYLDTGGELAGIRGKGMVFRPLREMSDSAKEAVKYANLLSAPLLLGAVGGVRLWRRRTR